ncbi:hypothetical protein D3C78_1126340 [compost metagenome]
MAAIKYVTPKDAAAVEGLIGKAVRSVQKARVDVQIAAVAILIHAEKHGDWTKANDLVTGLGNTINGKALVEWFVVYGGLVIDEEAAAFTGWNGAEHIKERFQEAKAKMWWDLKQTNPFKGFDLEAALKKVISDHERVTKKMDTMTDEEKAKVKTQVNADTIQAVMKLCNFEAIVG